MAQIKNSKYDDISIIHGFVDRFSILMSELERFCSILTIIIAIIISIVRNLIQSLGIVIWTLINVISLGPALFCSLLVIL